MPRKWTTMVAPKHNFSEQLHYRRHNTIYIASQYRPLDSIHEWITAENARQLNPIPSSMTGSRCLTGQSFRMMDPGNSIKHSRLSSFNLFFSTWTVTGQFCSRERPLVESLVGGLLVGGQSLVSAISIGIYMGHHMHFHGPLSKAVGARRSGIMGQTTILLSTRVFLYSAIL